MSMDPFELIKNETERQKKFWHIFICIPVFYLLLCAIIEKYYFAPNALSGFFSPGEKGVQYLLFIGIVCAVIAQGLLFFLKQYYYTRMKNELGNPEKLRSSLRMMFLLLASVCDTTSAIGLILFLLDGKIWNMLVFGSVSYFFYAQILPSESIISRINNSDSDDDSDLDD